MANSREKQATKAYLKFLENKGAPSGTLYRRSHFLDAFMEKLLDVEQTRKAYAFALEETLENLPSGERSNALNTAREYFPFWLNDIKAIALFHEYYGFSTNEINWSPKHATLEALTKDLDTEVFDAQEILVLNNYLQAIADLGADDTIITTRKKLAKIILLRLREAPTKTHAIYRRSVDLTLPLFKTKEIRELYLDVVREFYHFWDGAPNAEELTFGKS